MKAVRWEDTKRQVRELNPDWDTPEHARGSQIWVAIPIGARSHADRGAVEYLAGRRRGQRDRSAD